MAGERAELQGREVAARPQATPSIAPLGGPVRGPRCPAWRAPAAAPGVRGNRSASPGPRGLWRPQRGSGGPGSATWVRPGAPEETVIAQNLQEGRHALAQRTPDPDEQAQNGHGDALGPFEPAHLALQPESLGPSPGIAGDEGPTESDENQHSPEGRVETILLEEVEGNAGENHGLVDAIHRGIKK